MLDGLALASQYNNTQAIYGFCSRFFDTLLQLMTIYKTVMEVQLLILQLFTDLAGRLDFGQLDTNQKQMLFRIVIEIVKKYGENNRGKLEISNVGKDVIFTLIG